MVIVREDKYNVNLTLAKKGVYLMVKISFFLAVLLSNASIFKYGWCLDA